MTADQPPIDGRAEQVFRSARRGERLWPWALLAGGVYAASASWSFVRTFGAGGDAAVQALPTPWTLLAIAGLVVAGRIAAAVAEEAGDSPFRWIRLTRRLLIAAAFVLPIWCAVFQPLITIMAVDQGRTESFAPPYVVTVTITPR